MFSDRETKILKVLGRKTMKVEEIAVGVFEDDIRGFDSNQIIANTIIRIIKKCEFHNLPWTLNKNKKTTPMTITKGRRDD
jgi:hypothetical protein